MDIEQGSGLDVVALGVVTCSNTGDFILIS